MDRVSAGSRNVATSRSGIARATADTPDNQEHPPRGIGERRFSGGEEPKQGDPEGETMTQAHHQARTDCPVEDVFKGQEQA